MLALLPLILTMAPEIARWVSGNQAAAITGKAAEVVQMVTGTSDPDEATAVLQDPAKATELRVALAKIAADAEAAQRQAELAALQAGLADVANARAAAGASPLIARTQVGLAIGIIGMFAAVLVMMATRGVPQGAESLFNILLGALIAGQTAVVSFFFGNSTSGHAANNAMAAALARPSAAGQQGRG
jgi:hypothetical protein